MSLTEIFKRPLVIGIFALVAGFVLGLGWGWGLQPVEWVDAPVNLLRADLQDDYLRMTMDSYRLNGDAELAIRRYQELGPQGYNVFQAVKDNPGKLDKGFIDQFKDLLKQNNLYTPTAETAAPASNSNLSIAIIIGAVLAIAGVALAAFWLLRGGGRGSGPITPAQQAADLARSVEKTDYVAMGEAPPVAQYVTTYVIGDDLFDDSFSIDSPSGEFLGECGVGISETIGVGDPKKVTAFEVWMFDKNDIQTVTKVLMSPHAFKDAGFRAKLEAKGELVPVEPQKQVILETQTLQMTVTVSDMQYGQGALPGGSYFDRLTLELAIWSK